MDGDSKYCGGCGERLSGNPRFCPSCGARQQDYREPEPPPAEPEPALPARAAGSEPDSPSTAPEPEPAAEPQPTAPSLRERIERVDPQAAELSELLRARLAVPGLVGAAIAALLAAAAIFAAGLLLAVVTVDASVLGVLGRDVGLLTEAFRQSIATLLAPTAELGSETGRLSPMVLALVPLGAVALATRSQLHRTEGAGPLVRLAWAVAVAPLLALLMVAFAVLGGDTNATGVSPSAGGAFAMGLLWGVLGALAGVAGKVGLRSRERSAGLPPLVRTALAASWASLRALGVLLAVFATIGLVGWLAQVGAAAGDVRLGRTATVALLEEAAFAGEHGVHLAALAAGARFRPDADGAAGLPFPVQDAAAVAGTDGRLRIFSYDEALPAYVLLPALVVLIGLLILAGVYAGFAAGRAAGAANLRESVAWGAITGPAWALAMAIAVALAGGVFHGDADASSVLAIYLIGGAALGAAGGALAAGSVEPVPQPAPSAETSAR
ncbi:MAG: hypothetical protein KY433_07980 [Actinobacteria bacterium]|nr:hypothetical protein [Actinomycetota bacterium]